MRPADPPAERQRGNDIFRAATAFLGPRLRDRTLPLGTAAFHEFVGERADDLVAQARKVLRDLPPIHFDFIVNPEINAFAFRAEDRYFIGITTGTLWMLRMLIGRMLSDPRAFPIVGYAAGENAELKPVTDYVPDADAMYQANPLLTPRDPIRRDYAEFLQDQAIMFFVGHEIAHVTRGHVDYLTDRRQLPYSSEVSSTAATDEEVRLERQSLEQDADRRSIMSRIDSLRVTDLRRGERGLPWAPHNRGPARLVQDWSASLHIVFRLFGDPRLTSADSEAMSYPPLAVRRLYLDGVAAWQIETNWQAGLPIADICAALVRARLEVDEAFAVIFGEPTARSASGTDTAAHAMRLQDYWNSKLVERLRPYSYEF